MTRNKDNSMNFSDNHKPGFNPPPYRKESNHFPANKNFKKSSTKPYVPAPNSNNPVVAGGSNATPI